MKVESDLHNLDEIVSISSRQLLFKKRGGGV
jgi:hypothetical protein